MEGPEIRDDVASCENTQLVEGTFRSLKQEMGSRHEKILNQSETVFKWTKILIQKERGAYLPVKFLQRRRRINAT